jgi:hypothetical protein
MMIPCMSDKIHKRFGSRETTHDCDFGFSLRPFGYGNCGGTKATQVYTNLHIFDNDEEHVFGSSMEPMECSAEQRLSLGYRRGLS